MNNQQCSLIGQNEKIINKNEISMDHFVKNLLKESITKNEYLIISIGFKKVWNSSKGQIIGDGDIKNSVYRFIELYYWGKFPKQKLVGKCVDLMLNYMEGIGEYSFDFGIN